MTDRSSRVVAGDRDILRIWPGSGGGESGKFWLSVLTDLKNRGVTVRNTFRYASRKYWEQISRDLKPVYAAATPAAEDR